MFTIYLPRSREAPQRSAPARTGDTTPVESGSVLVVEDNTEVADIATAMLNELGYQVTRVAPRRPRSICCATASSLTSCFPTW